MPDSIQAQPRSTVHSRSGFLTSSANNVRSNQILAISVGADVASYTAGYTQQGIQIVTHSAGTPCTSGSCHFQLLGCVHGEGMSHAGIADKTSCYDRTEGDSFRIWRSIHGAANCELSWVD